jgi:hypothetical protein
VQASVPLKAVVNARTASPRASTPMAKVTAQKVPAAPKGPKPSPRKPQGGGLNYFDMIEEEERKASTVSKRSS